MMNQTGRSQAAESIDQAAQQLESLSAQAQENVHSVADAFEAMAHESDAMLHLAGAIVGCVQDEQILSILPRMQSLGEELRSFLQARQHAMSGILDTLAAEAKLLGQIGQLTAEQRLAARETQMLSMLTDIEIAHLGDAGSGFGYLATELNAFAHAVVGSTQQLSDHTRDRRSAIEQAQRKFGVALPRLALCLASAGTELARTLGSVELGLAKLAESPARLKASVEDIGAQIAGVVAAIQSQDITRQQTSHVRDALRSIASRIKTAERSEPVPPPEEQHIATGLTIQVCQLKNVAAAQEAWLARIRASMDAILHISSQDVGNLGPSVLARAGQLGDQLARMESLEQECHGGAAEIEETEAGLARLMELITAHLEQSRSVRDRLRLLMFNSIIEASRLGSQADAILEIARSIQRISLAWDEATDRSAAARDEAQRLTARVREELHAFSGAGQEALCHSQQETRASLERMRAAADFAAEQGGTIEAAIGDLRMRSAAVASAVDRLRVCFAGVAAVRGTIEQQKSGLSREEAQAGLGCNTAKAQALFGSAYTSERERAVLLAAVTGAALPEVELTAGNGIELF
ncbi:MAG TPA: methyl-accepting chemotaxis protein [Acidobacteriaceae bacterium]